MQAGEKTVGGFRRFKLVPLLAVGFQRNRAERLEQIGLILGTEKHLMVAKFAQFTGRLPPPNPTLLATQAPEETLDLQVVWG